MACGAVTAVAGRHAPRQGKVDLKVAGAAVVEPVAHPGGKRELPALQPFLAELPAAPAWSWLGDAGPPVDADHIVDAMCLEPCQEGGAGEAAVGQHDWADPGRQRLQDGGDRMFFELVLACVGGHPVAVVADFQQRQRAAAPRHGDPQDLVADPAALGAAPAGRDGVEHRPVHRQGEP